MKEMHFGKMIDVHTHILPGVDDGSRTITESLELVKMAIDAGFCAMIATPHYSKRRGTDGLEAVLSELMAEVEAVYPDFQIFMGHETYYHEDLTEQLKNGNAFPMAGSRYVLVEFDTGIGYQSMSRAIRRLLNQGYIPIIAHMERYYCLREERHLQDLFNSGCLLQMNYESLTGHWFQTEVRRCRKLVKEGMIHFLGTDMHRTDHRPPEISGAMKWLNQHVDKMLIQNMTYRNAVRMINNEKIS